MFVSIILRKGRPPVLGEKAKYHKRGKVLERQKNMAARLPYLL